MSDNLKPCPCCGEDMARVINDNDFFRVRCDYCGLQTEVNYKDEKGAIDSWNMRSSNWHTETPTEEGWYLTKVKVRDCDGSYFFMYEAVWFDAEEWVDRRHQQPVFEWQKIEED